jgi:hypothetical protein
MIPFNNPGNIRLIRLKSGAIPKPFNNEVQPGALVPGVNVSFRTFTSPEAGLRALYYVLINNFLHEGKDTLNTIIPVYAPAKDKNNPTKYIADVSKWTGIKPSQKIQMADLPRLAVAISRAEGRNKVSPQMANEVWNNYNNPAYFNSKAKYVPGQRGANKSSAHKFAQVWSNPKARTEITILGLSSILIVGTLIIKHGKNRRR